MINLAAAAVLVRDLTEQHLEGADGSAPAGRTRKAPSSGGAPAAHGRQAPQAGRAASGQRAAAARVCDVAGSAL
jgi:hypothetical protein